MCLSEGSDPDPVFLADQNRPISTRIRNSEMNTKKNVGRELNQLVEKTAQSLC